MGTSRLKVGAVDYSSVLESIFELMLSSGLPCEYVLAGCNRSGKRAETRSNSRRLRATGGLVSAALVLDAWHRDRRYLTPLGLPKAVRLLGRTPSVEALIRAHTGHRNASGDCSATQEFTSPGVVRAWPLQAYKRCRRNLRSGASRAAARRSSALDPRGNSRQERTPW